MKRSSFRGVCLGIVIVAGAAVSAAGCEPDNKVPAGAPVLTEVQVVDPEKGDPLFLLATVSADQPVFPATGMVVLVFDRLLDPTPLLEIDPDGGAIQPKGGIGSIDTSTVGAVVAGVDYTPNGNSQYNLAFPRGPALTLGLEKGSLPAASVVTVFLDPDKVRSHDRSVSFVVRGGAGGVPTYGGGATGPDGGTMGIGMPVVTFATQPATATLNIPPAPAGDGGAPDDGGAPEPATLAADFVAQVKFNFLTPDDTNMHIQVTGTAADGAAIPDLGAVTIERDGSAPFPLFWNVTPPATGWPPGATIAISVDGTVADPYGIALGEAVSGAFKVAP